jgi:hypothetical protein
MPLRFRFQLSCRRRMPPPAAVDYFAGYRLHDARPARAAFAGYYAAASRLSPDDYAIDYYVIVLILMDMPLIIDIDTLILIDYCH